MGHRPSPFTQGAQKVWPQGMRTIDGRMSMQIPHSGGCSPGGSGEDGLVWSCMLKVGKPLSAAKLLIR